MDSNFKVIKRDVDVAAILAQLEDSKFDWFPTSNWYTDRPSNPFSGIIPLTHANAGDVVGSNLVYNTMYYDKHPLIVNWLKENGFDLIARSAFFKLKAGGATPVQTDTDEYYHAKDRYCLVLRGTVEFGVGDDVHTVAPGTMFQYNGDKKYRYLATEDIDHIYFVFDVPAVGVSV